MTGTLDDLLARMRAALPESHVELDRIEAEAAADGLSDRLPELVLEEYTWAVLGILPRAERPDRARWQRWVTFLEGEYDRDRVVDTAIRTVVLTKLPRADADLHGIRDALGPRLAAALAANDLLRPGSELATQAFLARLRERFPELEAYVEDNLATDGRSLLATLFLADVARHAAAAYGRGGEEATRAQAIVEALEAGYGEDDDLDTAIATGFVEGLPEIDDAGARLVGVFGPNLRADTEGLRADLAPLLPD